jgi:hypothetical protein
MTQPTVIFFGHDGGAPGGPKRRLKVFLTDVIAQVLEHFS